MRYQGVVLGSLLFSLSACTVGPDYIKTESKINPHWAAATKQQQQTGRQKKINLSWWKQFHDPKLNALIEQSICANSDVKIAFNRIEQARTLYQIDAARGLPHFNVNSGVTNERISKTGRALGSLPPNLPGINTIPLVRDVYAPGFDASWELDVFGQIRRRKQASNANVEQGIEQLRDIRQTLIAEVGRNYFDLRSLQEQKRLLQRTIQIRQEAAKLNHQRLTVGEANQLRRDSSVIELKNIEAELAPIKAGIQAKISQLAYLTGKDPNRLMTELNHSSRLPSNSPKISLGLRSELLRRRADIRAAERGIAKASAEIGVAVADLYPKFSINGNYGLESLFYNQVFNPQSQVWMIGPFLNWAIFHSGQIRQNIHLKQTQFEEQILTYEKTVLQALAEVETNLSQYNELSKSLDFYRQAEQKAFRNYQLARQRYQAGEDNRLTYIQFEQALMNARLQRTQQQGQRLTQLVALYKALGGGWSAFENKSAG